MDNEIKKLELSNEIAFMECELSLKIDSYDIVIESQRDSFFVNAFKKLEETVEKVIDAIRNFVNSKVFKNKINALNDFARRNPEFGVRSIKIPDYKKLKKLNKETITKLIKSKFPDEELEKYKKALKAIFIGGGITVGINLCANVIKKSSEEQIKDMEELKLKLFSTNSQSFKEFTSTPLTSMGPKLLFIILFSVATVTVPLESTVIGKTVGTVTLNAVVACVNSTGTSFMPPAVVISEA